MKIAFIGQKGVPATFGGVETHVDSLATILTRRGHDVTVYVRNWYTPTNLRQYNLIRLVHSPTIRTKHLDAFTHSLTSSLHSLSQHMDIIHYHAIGPTLFSWIPVLFNKKVIATIHRLDWQAGKWGPLARASLKLAERLAVSIPAQTIVVSRNLQGYLEMKYQRRVVCIPNGVHLPNYKPPIVITEKYGLKGKDYILFMGRFVPEKRVEWVIEAFKAVDGGCRTSGLKLVLAGGSSATNGYVRDLHRRADKAMDIIFTGYVTGQEKDELLSNAHLFVLPSYLEGNPIALLEAMSFGIPCLVSDILPHREIITDGKNGMSFHAQDFTDLVFRLRIVLQRTESQLEQLAEEGRQHVKKHYDWNTIATETEKVYHSIAY